MSQKNKFVKKRGNAYRSIIAAALVVNGIFQFVAPVLAEGSAGGESISNTATATYEDPNNPGETINTTSNTVVVTVAEVAGVTVVGSGTEFDNDANADGKISVGDTVYYNYTVTNVGNDPTKIRVPDQPTVTGPATLDGDVEISYDGGTTWVPVAQGGTISDSIDPDQSILVRVPVKVAPGAQSGDKITVKLGDTPGDDQNIPRTSDGGDVYTVDNPTADPQPIPGEVNGDPANGTREASATQEVTVDSDLKTYTLAKILKTRTDHTIAGADGPQDDTVTYDLSLEVENTDPTGQGLTPAPLQGAVIPGLAGNNILVSDAIPVGTQLESVVAPSGWQAVYTDTPVGTKANAATWQNLDPANIPANVTRVGFVRTTSVAPGQTVNGFKVTVKVTSTDDTVIVANIAQLFGESPSGNDVYDESGDNNPSNYDPDTQLFPGTTQPGQLPPDPLPDTEIDDGSIDPTDTDGDGNPDANENPVDVEVDKQNNNTGTGAGGEANVFTIEKAGDVSVLTGPQGAPDAVAENDNNKDFTNKSSFVPSDTAPGSTFDPDGVSFSNTVQNTGIAPADITVLPTQTVLADPAELPDGTLVTISYQSQSATYEYNGSAFVAPGGGALPSPVVIPGVAPGATDDYGVEVNLPPNTPLSTDIEKGFPTPIVAFVDEANGNGQFDGIEPNNITIDRVYTGYLKMVKESRVLKATGPDVLAGQETFSVDPKNPAPGNILEYRIRYKNISEAQSGTSNVILNASDIEITEDGTLSTAPGDGKNNWALDNDGNGEIDTSNITGSATDSANANIQFSPGGDQTGTTGATDVTKYVVTVSDDVAPQEERTFTFQRRINDTGLTGNTPAPPAP